MSAQPDIIYTKVDEAPQLASGSFLPIIQSYAKTPSSLNTVSCFLNTSSKKTDTP